MPALTLLAGSTNRPELTPDIEPDSVTLSLTDHLGVSVAGIPALTEVAATETVAAYWYTDIPHTAVPTTAIGHEWTGGYTMVQTVDGSPQYTRVAVRAFVVAESLTVNYSDYIDAGFSTVPFSEWPRYIAWAGRELAAITMRRDLTATDYADYADQIALARLVIADACYASDTGIVAESLGSYSYTLASPRVGYSPARVGAAALSGTGLCYRGV